MGGSGILDQMFMTDVTAPEITVPDDTADILLLRKVLLSMFAVAQKGGGWRCWFFLKGFHIITVQVLF